MEIKQILVSFFVGFISSLIAGFVIKYFTRNLEHIFLIAVSAFVVSGTLSLLLFPMTKNSANSVKVPDVLNLSRAEAKIAIENRNLIYSEKEIPNNTVPLNRVISQDPQQGLIVLEGTVISVCISGKRNPLRVTVPDVRNLSLADAKSMIEDRGLIFETIQEFSDIVAKYKVISQDPLPGITIFEGEKVIVKISKGARPASISIPNVCNLSYADAKAKVENEHLIFEINEEFHGTIPKGAVISQEPLPGIIVEAGDIVLVKISKGPSVTAIAKEHLVPTITGMSEYQAKTIIENAGFLFKPNYKANNSIPKGSVVEQFPSGKRNSEIGSTIEVIISEGPELLPGELHIEFLYPKDDEVIFSPPGITRLACKGKVLGNWSGELRISLRIWTDQWYPQGSARVKSDGSWEIMAHLGGANHTLEAQAIDDQGNVLASNSITVTRIQE